MVAGKAAKLLLLFGLLDVWACPSRAHRSHRLNMETDTTHAAAGTESAPHTASDVTTHLPFLPTASATGSTAPPESAVSPPRIVICSLLKNEVPYAVEWIEFHRLMGASKIVIYDDFSTDNVTLLNQLYQQHGRDYLVVEPGIWDEDGRARRGLAGSACFDKYHAESDWLINLDVDEFVWSPVYGSLTEFFQHEVPTTNHILYVGATRFGWGGQRHRFSYLLTEVSQCSSSLLFPTPIPIPLLQTGPPVHPFCFEQLPAGIMHPCSVLVLLPCWLMQRSMHLHQLKISCSAAQSY